MANRIHENGGSKASEMVPPAALRQLCIRPTGAPQRACPIDIGATVFKIGPIRASIRMPAIRIKVRVFLLIQLIVDCMTAEIAILNKTAVALAADSAVTVSAGSKHEKVFDTADKLFELCSENPIGIMIYNGMSFAEAPLPALICEFKDLKYRFSTVEEAAEKFLSFLAEFGRSSPLEVADIQLISIIQPVLDSIATRFSDRFKTKMLGVKTNNVKEMVSITLDEQLIDLEKVIKQQAMAKFIGGTRLRFTPRQNEIIRAGIVNTIDFASAAQQERMLTLIKEFLRKDLSGDGRTGVVVAGFGSNEKFPTLLSFEIDGMISGKLKYSQTNFVDIDRKGPRASVIPFAQKEMVERFLYGLDDSIQTNISSFSAQTIPAITEKLFATVEFEDDDLRRELLGDVREAEKAFLNGLERDAFRKIRDDYRAEIEDMVEFMPKPELAKMAEALVSLTSIKRRVSRGMETVGGPIDVALISRSEGFIWVKRKHYFPAELNSRYFARVGRPWGHEPKQER